MDVSARFRPQGLGIESQQRGEEAEASLLQRKDGKWHKVDQGTDRYRRRLLQRLRTQAGT